MQNCHQWGLPCPFYFMPLGSHRKTRRWRSRAMQKCDHAPGKRPHVHCRASWHVNFAARSGRNLLPWDPITHACKGEGTCCPAVQTSELIACTAWEEEDRWRNEGGRLKIEQLGRNVLVIWSVVQREWSKEGGKEGTRAHGQEVEKICFCSSSCGCFRSCFLLLRFFSGSYSLIPRYLPWATREGGCAFPSDPSLFLSFLLL